MQGGAVSVYTVTTRLTREYLMRKSKDDLVTIILANLEHIDLLKDLPYAPSGVAHLTGPYGRPLYRLAQHPDGTTTVERR